MTLLVTDPRQLLPAQATRIRLILQVCTYDFARGILLARRPSVLSSTLQKVEEQVSINVSSIANKMDVGAITPGHIVDIDAYYDGSTIHAFDYRYVDTECFLADPQAAETLDAISRLKSL